ncbi:MAG: flagellar export protein FliJ [Planctomycetota bacterium]
MPPYKFRFEVVRRVRQTRRDELRGELAAAYQAAEKLADEKRSLEAELQQLRQHMTATAAAKQMNIGSLLDSQRYELILKSQIVQVDRKAQLVEQEIDRRRQAVVAAEREVKVMDTLDAKGQQLHRVEEMRADNKQMDEIAGVLTARRNRSAT